MQGIFQITSLSLQCPADKDGRSCRSKAACSVSMTSDYGTHNWTERPYCSKKTMLTIFTLISLILTEICDRLIFENGRTYINFTSVINKVLENVSHNLSYEK